jgi:hypothetical protein
MADILTCNGLKIYSYLPVTDRNILSPFWTLKMDTKTRVDIQRYKPENQYEHL